MMGSRSLLAATLAAALLATPLPAAAQSFFRMDYSSALSPSGGWEAFPVTPRFTRSRIAGAGPEGEDVYELTQLSTGASQPEYGGEFYWGWRGLLEAQQPAQGSRRYYRWWMRFSPTTNFRGLHGDGSPTTLTNKVLIVGDGCGRSDCRVIVNYRGNSNYRQANFRIQIDGGDQLVDAPPVDVGMWFSVQVELDSSTSTSSRDGAYKIWINNNDYSRPTAQRSGFQLNPVGWNYVMLGGYNNDGLASNGVHSFRQTGFEASLQFDPNFHQGGTFPNPPMNLRIVP